MRVNRDRAARAAASARSGSVASAARAIVSSASPRRCGAGAARTSGPPRRGRPGPRRVSPAAISTSARSWLQIATPTGLSGSSMGRTASMWRSAETRSPLQEVGVPQVVLGHGGLDRVPGSLQQGRRPRRSPRPPGGPAPRARWTPPRLMCAFPSSTGSVSIAMPDAERRPGPRWCPPGATGSGRAGCAARRGSRRSTPRDPSASSHSLQGTVEVAQLRR